ncbi:kinase-like domain-containing protein [Biscogniauxia marginata]|nr:kinase-like domain-containing protein [Biscogniauxia marginata]
MSEPDPLLEVTVESTSTQSAETQRLHWFRAGQFDMFKYYRQGKYWPFMERYGAEYSNPVLPLQGQPKVEMPGQRQRLIGYYRDDRPSLNIDELGKDTIDREHARGWDTLQTLKSNFKIPGLNIRYNKLIGWGGQGLVTTFDVLAETGEVAKKLVVKAHFPDAPETRMEQERKMMHILRKADHIVQLLYAEGDGLNPDDDSKMDTDDDDDDSEKPPLTVLIMEMVENGDLADFITKVQEHEERIPNTVLWRFLLCPMAYPPAARLENADNPGPITETIPQQLQNQPSRMVHFDFDPYNVFLGGVTSDSEHNITPILKLGDFGCTLEIKSGQEDFYYERLRSRGKMGFFAPEQFSHDWDYVARGSNLISRHRIAGNYGAHTNVWGIGLISEALITLSRPALPPKPTETTYSHPPNKPSYHTYAFHLTDNDYSHVDRDLRGLVLRLQAHLPEDRPRLHEIEYFAKTVVTNRKFPNESDEEVRRWLNKILFEPPPASNAPTPAAVSPSPEPAPEKQPLKPLPGQIGPGPVRNIPIPVFFRQGNQVPEGEPAPSTPPPPREPQAPQTTVIMGGDDDDNGAKTPGGRVKRRGSRYHPYGVPPNTGGKQK